MNVKTSIENGRARFYGRIIPYQRCYRTYLCTIPLILLRDIPLLVIVDGITRTGIHATVQRAFTWYLVLLLTAYSCLY